MDFEKNRVPLSAIRPSEVNPRDDMGDLEALADAIRATGGEPVNPPVLVADGNVFRIVDGERRYRALCKIYADEPDREVAALVAGGLDAANELAAMLATDDKKPLTDAERGRGVQQMLLLGVDEVRVARASRADLAKVRAAKRVAAEVPAGSQVTIDQMAAAEALEGADREAVLAAGGDWVSKTMEIKRRDKDRRRREALRAAVEAAGMTLADEPPEGWARAGWLCTDKVSKIPEKAAAFSAGCVVVDRGPGVADVYASEGADGRSDERAAAERERAALLAAMSDLAERATAFAVSADADTSQPELAEAARELRDRPRLMDEEAFRAWEAAVPVGEYERRRALLSLAEGYIDDSYLLSEYIPGNVRPKRARHWLDAVDLLELCGFEEEDGAARLIGAVRDMADAEVAG